VWEVDPEQEVARLEGAKPGLEVDGGDDEEGIGDIIQAMSSARVNEGEVERKGGGKGEGEGRGAAGVGHDGEEGMPDLDLCGSFGEPDWAAMREAVGGRGRPTVSLGFKVQAVGGRGRPLGRASVNLQLLNPKWWRRKGSTACEIILWAPPHHYLKTDI
jgi:hypothetical protein